MYCDVRQWRHIRRRILEKGTPKKQVARETGVSRRTINKMLTHEHPPGYGPRPLRYPKLEPYIQTIDRLLHDTISFPPGAHPATLDLGRDDRAGTSVEFFLARELLAERACCAAWYSITLGAIALGISAIREMFAANTPLDVRKPSTEIVTSGVFRKSRNPVYLGMLLLCAGVAFLANSLWILILVLPLAIILQKGVIEPEESYLEKKFGDKYLRYKAKVRRWI
jgi:hypothetical protein